MAHAAVCVPDVEAATRWYSDVLGLTVLSPPYRMEGEQIERDMGELLPSPVVVTAAILGFGADDRVIELIEYPAAGVAPARTGAPWVSRIGITHVAGLETTWCRDPWGTVIILLQKSRHDRPYWGQLAAPT
jgi:catechol 2,3-dioxygenase-like lactoylglutathione lyase family enzyme